MAALEDVPDMVRMGARMHSMSPWSGRPFDPDATANMMAGLIASPDGVLLWTGEAMLGGLIVPIYFGGGRVAQELFWFADRGGLALLTAFEAWAKDKGADVIVMASLALGPEADERLGRLYERRGYKIRERHYAKEV
jgi:hypothetical protein